MNGPSDFFDVGAVERQLLYAGGILSKYMKPRCLPTEAPLSIAKILRQKGEVQTEENRQSAAALWADIKVGRCIAEPRDANGRVDVISAVTHGRPRFAARSRKWCR